MNEHERDVAERALRLLLVGASVMGVHWYGALVAVIARAAAGSDKRFEVTYDEIYLTLESHFKLFGIQSQPSPVRIDDIQEAPFHERVETLAYLARDTICDVSVGSAQPDLLLHFESGRVLFINGSDQMYESWTVQTNKADGGEWTVVAVPGNDIALFAPKRGIDHVDNVQ
jgi:hypothetical protein